MRPARNAGFFVPLFLCASIAQAQVITTIAGTDWIFPVTPIRALDAPLGPIIGVAVDSSGNVYSVDRGNCLVEKIAPDGTLTIATGTGLCFFSGDGGPADHAGLVFPTAVAAAPNGTLYVQDNTRLRKISAGVIATIANTALASSLAVDAAGNVFLAEPDLYRVRKLDPNGVLTTIAGTGTAGSSGDNGPASAAQLNYPISIGFDPDGNLLVAERDSGRIRKIAPSGTITTLVQGPVGLDSVAAGANGAIYFHASSAQLFRFAAGGQPQLIAGTGTAGVLGDNGPAFSAQLGAFDALAVDAGGGILLGEFSGRVRRVTPGGTITRLGGNGNYRFTAGPQPALTATFDSPSGLALDAAGNLYISDRSGGRIRSLSGGVVSTIGGTGTSGVGSGIAGNNGDGGPALQASILSPVGLASDSAGDLLIAETGLGAVRKIAPNGSISSVVSLLFGTRDVSLDGKNNLFIASADGSSDNSVYRTDQKTKPVRIAGGAGAGFSGDGGAAVHALLNAPSAVLADASGNVYVSDQGNNRVRAIGADGAIRTIAGNGGTGRSGDGGLAVNAEIGAPGGLALDQNGNLFVADTRNSVIRKIAPTGTITTVAGSGNIGFGFAGDGGPPTKANLSLSPDSHIAVDSSGTLYIADTGDQRIRAILSTPPAFSATPTDLTFAAASGGAISTPQTIVLAGSITGLLFSVAVDTQGSGNWLTASPTSGVTPRLIDVVTDPARLAPGTYRGTVNITAPDAIPSKIAVNVTLTVGAAQPAKLAVDRTNLSFAFPAGGSARSQTVVASNQGGGTLAITATVTGSGFSVSPASATLAAGQSASLAVTANPSGLAAGTYEGVLTIRAANGDSASIPLTMLVSANQRVILLTQTGLSFRAVEQGGIVPPQSFAVVNAGAGVVNFSVSTSTLSGGSQWLSAAPTSGLSDAAQPPPVISVQINPSGLKAGSYYGLVKVDSAGAANTPQVVTVFLQILPAGSELGAIIQPAELVFTFPQGQLPGSQDLFIFNPTGTAKTYQVITAGSGVTMAPGTGSVAPNAPARVVVQPGLTGLSPGIVRDVFTFQFSDGRVSNVRVTFVVTPAPSGSTAARSAGSCAPTTLLPSLTTLGPQFQVSAGWPVALLVDVRDDCGNPLTGGAVSAAFSNGDQPLSLLPLKDGRWQATWQTGSASRSQVTITLTASNSASQLNGSRQVSGEFLSQQDPPILDASGVVSSAVPVSYSALAPGGLFTIYGSRLSDDAQTFAGTPLPTQLGNTQVIMAGQTLPLLFAGPGQINAQVPFGITTNTTHQVLVQRGATYSVPVPVNVSASQPALFLSGGAAIVQAFRGTDPPFLVSSQSPAKAGDVIVLYGTGLGATDQVVVEGTTSPASPLAQTRLPATLSIGGQNAPVAFAGLVPGFVGLYQLNSQIPAGVPAGTTPIVISIAGRSSPPANTFVDVP